MVKKCILKMSGCKYDGFAFEVDYEKKTYAIGYCTNTDYDKIKTSKKDFMKVLSQLQNNGFTMEKKTWI